MATSIDGNNEHRCETSVDHQLLCTICNKLLNDPQYLSCGHTFCLQCIVQKTKENDVSCSICQQFVSIKDLTEIDHTVTKEVNDIPVEYNEKEQTTLHSQNIHES